MDWNERDARDLALEQAMKLYRADSNAAAVVRDAKVFLKFLNGGK